MLYRIYYAARRRFRNTLLKVIIKNPFDYYKIIVNDDAKRDPNAAVGGYSQELWNEIGVRQFEYLSNHGLLPNHKLLEIGCGNLRAGLHFIRYLNKGNYYGTDISWRVIEDGKGNLSRHHLMSKSPHLFVTDSANYDFFEDNKFDVIHAHGVFTNMPSNVLTQHLIEAKRLLKKDGFFDFTFREGKFLDSGENTSFPMEHVVAIIESVNLKYKVMHDWDRSYHNQTKIRIIK